jgi:myo-inositol-1(or 4)-monophosphatase
MNILSPSDLRFFAKIVLKAGKKARRIQKHGFSAARKDDASIVTEADTLAQEYLVKKISARFKDAAIICEENFDRSKNLMDKEKLSVIIDPVDGTAVFSMGLPFWCVSVGIFDGFKPAYGFIYSPGCGMFFSNDDHSAFCNGRVIKADKQLAPESETNVFFASDLLKNYELAAPGKIRNLGSTALHAVFIADNKKSRGIAFVGSGNLWDWAAAIPILQKSGAGVKYMSGREIDFSEVAANAYRFPEVMLAYSAHDFESAKKIFKAR